MLQSAQDGEFLAAVAGDEVAGAAHRLQERGEGNDRGVAGLVAELVVDVLEVVDVRHDQAAGQVRFLMRGDEVDQHPVELGAVGDLRERILRDLQMQGLAAFFQGRFARGVVQQHGRALHHAVAAADGDRVEVDRDVPAVAAHDVDAADRLDAGLDRAGDRALIVRNAALVVVVHVEQAGQEHPPERGLAADAGEPLDAGVPEHDAAIGVDEQHAVVHVVDEHLLEQRHGRGGGGNGARFAGDGSFPGQVARVLREIAEPMAGELLGQQVLILGKQLAEFADQLGVELAAGALE